jgi:hypothetical protein
MRLESLKVICQTSKTKAPNLCWNEEWKRAYESPWSLFEKLKYANQASNYDLRLIIGTQQLIEKKSKIINVKDRNLTSLSGFSERKLEELFGVNLKVELESFFQYYISVLPNSKKTLLEQMKPILSYCVSCIKKGYHSYLHQLSFIDSCPFHNQKLLSKCDKCKANIPYRLNHYQSTEEFEPFQCPNCKNYLYEPTSNFTKEWKINDQVIKKMTIKKWLNINSTEREDLASLIVPYSKMNQKDFEKVIKIISHKINIGKNHRIIRSSNGIMKYENQLREYTDACHSLNEDKILRAIIYTNRSIHESTKDVVNAVSKHIRRSLIPRHQSCIVKIRNLHEQLICPYAFAYLHWRKSVEYRKSIRLVDTICLDRAKHHFHPSFASMKHRGTLFGVLNKWAGPDSRRKYESLAATKWVLNRVLGECLIQHYNDWLHCALNREKDKDELVEQRNKFEYDYLPYKYDNKTDFIIRVPNRNNWQEAIEFHYWDNPNTDKNVSKHLTCPYGK